MENMLISVIVPIYNTEKYLDKCIASICRQTYENLEIILVDDGSTDGSLSICRKYQSQDNRIKIISQENKGLIEARKHGLIQARGDVVGFVDSDDWIEEEMYEDFARSFARTQADLISSGMIRDYDDGRSVITYDHYKEGMYNSLAQDIYPTMLYDDDAHDFGLYCNLVNKLFKKHILLKTYEEIDSRVFYGEDALTIYTYCLMAKSIYIKKKAFYHYSIRQESMCSKKDERLLYNAYLLYSELKKQFDKYENPYVLIKQLKQYILRIEAHNLKILYNIDINSLGYWKFDYDEPVLEKRIVIYGAGGCGQAFYRYLRKIGMDTHVVGWVDRNPNGKEEQCLYKIQEPEVLRSIEFDYVIIAVLKEDMASVIRKQLMEQYNLESEAIIWRQPEYVR